MVIIGSARGNEWGGIYGGEAGDQTGKEVCTEKFYPSRLIWRIFRAKDPEVRKKLAYDMQAACNNPNVGYNQRDNQSLYNVVKFLGWDCSKVETPCNTDCSQLTRVCILYAGIPIGFFSTAEEPDVIMSTGAFMEMTGPEYYQTGEALQPGDILCTSSKGHSAIVVSVEDPKLEEDGYWGSETTKRTQEYFGTPADGEIWKQYIFNRKWMPAATTGWKWTLFPGSGSPVIKKLQELIGAEPDGIMGKNSIQHLQVFLANNDLYFGELDGVLGYLTVLGWQKYLNR